MPFFCISNKNRNIAKVAPRGLPPPPALLPTVGKGSFRVILCAFCAPLRFDLLPEPFAGPPERCEGSPEGLGEISRVGAVREPPLQGVMCERYCQKSLMVLLIGSLPRPNWDSQPIFDWWQWAGISLRVGAVGVVGAIEVNQQLVIAEWNRF